MAAGNHLIDSLKEPARSALLAVLTPSTIAAGEVLIREGEVVRRLHFPTTAHLINRLSNARGQTLQVTFIGHEGVSGLAPFLADAPCSWSVMGQGEGQALVGSAQEIRRLAEVHPGLMKRLLQLSHFYQAIAHQMAIEATYETITARLASWLLTAFDLAGRREIRVTQDEIAHHLGVQRTSIVEAYGVLAEAGAVKVVRGRVTLLDEAALRQSSGGLFDPDEGDGPKSRRLARERPDRDLIRQPGLKGEAADLPSGLVDGSHAPEAASEDMIFVMPQGLVHDQEGLPTRGGVIRKAFPIGIGVGNAVGEMEEIAQHPPICAGRDRGDRAPCLPRPAGGCRTGRLRRPSCAEGRSAGSRPPGNPFRCRG